MLTLLGLFFIFAAFTKISFVILKLVGKMFGFMFGIIGYLILGAIAMSIFGAALASIVVIVLICVIAGAGISAAH